MIDARARYRAAARRLRNTGIRYAGAGWCLLKLLYFHTNEGTDSYLSRVTLAQSNLPKAVRTVCI